ncbi:membrane protein insertion efficiency factor YidD [Dokdonia ponticola]|uniref:Membrane protein insertion efficiency factor YidD n=1 Tax=Dokdonia ponticola TaxID=2041041 RepID=A0ABV9I0A3_9FLAO
MKYIFLVIIRLYWLLIPVSKRRVCIFKKSCSRYVYDITLEEGFKSGFQAFCFRYKNCRNNYELFKNPMNGEIQMILADNSVVVENEISNKLIKYKYNGKENSTRKTT